LVVEHTIERFHKCEKVDEIAIVCHENYLETMEEIVIKNGYHKVKKILMGGRERYHSSLAAIEAYDEDVHLIFHDAVRPLVSERIVRDVIDALDACNAVDVAIPAADTIIEVEGNHIVNIPDRSRLYRGQTPQAFLKSTIEHAYKIALKDPNFKATDDCGVVKKYLPEEEIRVVPGEEINMKLTYPEDFYLLEKFFQLKSTRILDREQGVLEKLKDKVLVIFGANYGIGAEMARMAEKFGAHVYRFSRTLGGVDVSDSTSVREALASVVEKEGGIDFLVNTAGSLHKEPLNHMDYPVIEGEIGVNYMGSISVAKEGFDYLKKSGGSLLLFTSSSYTRGRAMYSVYSSTKAAIVNLVQALSEEWEIFGISVNCINPERTATPMRKKTFGDEDETTLLRADQVAEISLRALLLDYHGQVIDVRLADLGS